MFFYGLTSDQYIKFMRIKEGQSYGLENRLLHQIIGAALLPLGLVFYGWTLNFRVHFVVPLVASGFVGFCVIVAILPTENYLADAYPVQTALAIAAGVILRALAGALFPLYGPPSYQRLGYGWGNTVVALITAVFFPFLFYLLRHGEKLREKEEL